MDFDSKAKTWDDSERTERARKVADNIRERVRLTQEMTGFEFGCGTGLLSFALRNDLGRIDMADSSDGMLEVLRDKIAAGGIGNMRPVKLDLAVDPLPADRYDLVYSLMTLHHIVDTGKVLRDLHALLKSPGTLCIADLDQEDGSFHREEFSGHDGFDRGHLKRQVEQAGFKNVSFSTVLKVNKDGRDYPVFLMVAEKR